MREKCQRDTWIFWETFAWGKLKLLPKIVQSFAWDITLNHTSYLRKMLIDCPFERDLIYVWLYLLKNDIKKLLCRKCSACKKWNTKWEIWLCLHSTNLISILRKYNWDTYNLNHKEDSILKPLMILLVLKVIDENMILLVLKLPCALKKKANRANKDQK